MKLRRFLGRGIDSFSLSLIHHDVMQHKAVQYTGFEQLMRLGFQLLVQRFEDLQLEFQ